MSIGTQSFLFSEAGARKSLFATSRQGRLPDSMDYLRQFFQKKVSLSILYESVCRVTTHEGDVRNFLMG